MEITVVCWLWQRGFRGAMYRNFHVNALESMVKKNLTIPHRFVCITDSPEGVNCETYKMWNDDKLRVRVGPNRPNCYQRLKMFSGDMKKEFGPKVLSLDLDIVINKNIDHFITDDPIKTAKGKAAPKNGSVLLIQPGVNEKTYSSFNSKESPGIALRWATAAGIQNKGSDQAWISYKHYRCPTWEEKDGLYHFTLLRGDLPDNAAIVCFAGGIKPWMLETWKRYPELYKTYLQAMYETDGPVPKAKAA